MKLSRHALLVTLACPYPRHSWLICQGVGLKQCANQLNGQEYSKALP